MGLGRRNRDRARFEEEALPHLPSLYRFAVGMARDAALAEDIVQETCQQAWQSFHRYEPGSDCKAWLFRILLRCWNRRWKRRQPTVSAGLDDVPEARLAVQPGVLEALERVEVLKLLQSLPEHYQTVLVLADVEEFTYREIAGMTGLPIGTVMSRLNRARNLLRAKIQEARDCRSA